MRFSGGCIGEVAMMEIPLAFPMLLSTVGQEDEDDVPPSPTPDPATPANNSQVLFQRGFLDCAEEAVHFLTDVGGMAADSPVIAGLKQHLVLSTQQLTPASLASPFFAFPSPVSGGGVVRRKHHVNSLPSSMQGDSRSGVTSGWSDSARFAPYSVASHGSTSSRQSRAGMQKDSSAALTSQGSSVLHSSLRAQSITCPLTRGLENVVRDDLISTDDLHGVLRCLQSVQSPAVPQHHPGHAPAVHQSNLQHAPTVHPSTHTVHPSTPQHAPTVYPSTHLSTPTVHQSTHTVHPPTPQHAPTVHPSTHMSTPICCQSEHSGHSCAVSSKVNSCSSLNDSGVSLDLTDEVDGPCHNSAVDEVDGPCHNSAIDGASDQVFHSSNICDSERRVTGHLSDRTAGDSEVESFNSSLSTARLSTYTSSAAFTSPSSSLSTSVSASVSMLPESSPSSQLSLLSSLSSGTHRLTAQSGDGSATASRIQSLANEILLLLQEEADDEDDDDDNDDESDVDDENYSDESDEDSAVEMEP